MKVFIIAALSADGFISPKKDTNSFNWTSKADKQWFIKKSKDAGVVIYGRKTYETFNKPLPNRLNIVYSRKKNVKKTLDQALLDKSETKTRLCFTDLLPSDLIKKLDSAGYSQVAICGGATIYDLFMKSGVVNTLYLTHEPVIFGQGVSLFKSPYRQEIKLEKIHKLDEQTVVMEYEVK